jgi:hypothetical protein
MKPGIPHVACFALGAVALGFLLGGFQLAVGQVTQVHTFEDGLEGFGVNGNGMTVDLNTDSNFASEGSNSLKFDFGNFGSFAGGLTAELKPEINNPPGVDFVRFDFINTNRYVPDEPVPGQTPTFAQTGITVFGVNPEDSSSVQVQFQFTEVPIGNLEPGTHEIEIDLTTGGLVPGSGDIKGFNEWFGPDPGQFVITGLQIYFNKNANVPPAFAWTFYVDNIRVGREQAAVEGDYNGDGIVNAADYTVWRNNLGLMGGATPSQGDGNVDGNVTEADYTFWKERFGMGGGGSFAASAVPEPSSLFPVLGTVSAGICMIRRRFERSAEAGYNELLCRRS